MAKFYLNGFYDSVINAGYIPDGAKPITDDTYNSLMTAQANGKIIKPDTDGNPIAEDYQPSDQELLNIFKRQVQSALDDSDITMNRISEAISLGLNTWTNSDVIIYVNYRRSLRPLLKEASPQSIPAHPPYPAGT